jgi:general secretion pathway protein F
LVITVLFNVKTLDASQMVHSYNVSALDEAEVIRQIAIQGQKLISITQVRSGLFQRREARIPLVTFSQELVSLLDAGLSLVEALETLSEKETNEYVKQVLVQLLARLFEGRTFAAALAEHPHSFPPLYVAAVRASERTGALQESLTRFVTYQQQIDYLRKTVVNASIYPIVLTIAGTLVTLFLMGYVVPRFSVIYEELGDGLPLASRLLMKWGQLLDAHAAGVAITFVSAVSAAIYGLTRASVRTTLANWIAKIPTIGNQLFLYQLARFFRTSGMLLRGGIPVVTALQMSSGLLGANLQLALERATRSVREGQSLAVALENENLTTPVAARMLRVGQRAGNLGEMMERIAAFYDEEMSRWVAIVTRLIEPILMSVIGIIIGLIVVLMYFPIFELAGSIK